MADWADAEKNILAKIYALAFESHANIYHVNQLKGPRKQLHNENFILRLDRILYVPYNNFSLRYTYVD